MDQEISKDDDHGLTDRFIVDHDDDDDDQTMREVKDLDKDGQISMPTPEQEEEVVRKKYGGMLPKKKALISKDHERAFFDSADWALNKQAAEKPKGQLEALLPKLQPTPHHQMRSRRLAYVHADDVDSGNNHTSDDDDNNKTLEAASTQSKQQPEDSVD
ncbi:uncharacterized protein LOC126654100 isoform X2 [Mercurialis annua]|uniref:uncharacterized protein LOC126654100 isoform X2 n=1 Tax=Mercurialis annua TaxID=3986 RepID=UPI00215EFB41|nr:uncharacterized protein LOC126654100 isoform X2 [Mercurialis annua]